MMKSERFIKTHGSRVGRELFWHGVNQGSCLSAHLYPQLKHRRARVCDKRFVVVSWPRPDRSYFSQKCRRYQSLKACVGKRIGHRLTRIRADQEKENCGQEEEV